MKSIPTSALMKMERKRIKSQKTNRATSKVKALLKLPRTKILRRQKTKLLSRDEIKRKKWIRKSKQILKRRKKSMRKKLKTPWNPTRSGIGYWQHSWCTLHVSSGRFTSLSTSTCSHSWFSSWTGGPRSSKTSRSKQLLDWLDGMMILWDIRQP